MVTARITYRQVHYALVRDWGAAGEFDCDCGEPAHEWAYLGGDPDELLEDGLAYSLDPKRYKPMCRSCHRRLDRRQPTCANGHEQTDENVYVHPVTGWRKCRACENKRHAARRANRTPEQREEYNRYMREYLREWRSQRKKARNEPT